MISRVCQRCGAPLAEPEDAGIARCIACGTLQVRLSEELRATTGAERERYEESLASGSSGSAGADTNWRLLIGYAAGAAVVAVVLCGVVPALVSLAWLVPIPVLLLYRRRCAGAVVTPLTGARVGALVGLLCSAGAFAAAAASLAVMRFALHRMGGFDALFSASLAAAQKQAALQSGPAEAAQAVMFAQPEFRAGMLLLVVLLLAGIFILLCVVSGTLAAVLQQRRGIEHPVRAGDAGE